MLQHKYKVFKKTTDINGVLIKETCTVVAENVTADEVVKIEQNFMDEAFDVYNLAVKLSSDGKFVAFDQDGFTRAIMWDEYMHTEQL